MASTFTLSSSETSVYAGQPVNMQVTIVNGEGSTMTIQDVLIQSDPNRTCTFVRSDELPATLADGDTLVVPFVATFRAQAVLDPATKVYLSFPCTGILKRTVADAYGESSTNEITINAINPGYTDPTTGLPANVIQGQNTSWLGLNFTSNRRSAAIPVVL